MENQKKPYIKTKKVTAQATNLNCTFDNRHFILGFTDQGGTPIAVTVLTGVTELERLAVSLSYASVSIGLEAILDAEIIEHIDYTHKSVRGFNDPAFTNGTTYIVVYYELR